ncbi:hypothetical protein PR202_gb15544 [Eleusine coracana subsp. coracana]|uniref:Uncharacterized protein n=1 Tax=Eleusine coracana subsp. coracana TaxID=191504 RepID=A0AAV5EY66_ELECO|nr:hypothetical protein PR202_gb15544 [Eleusine coracana subsp. coracana]
MAIISQLKGDEYGKSYRIPISFASISIIPKGSEHSAVIQSTENSEKKKSLETRGKDAYRGQNVSLTDCGDDGWSTIKDSTAETIVFGEDKEVSDDNEYPVTNVLARSRHRDGSIYRDMDSWWKEEYHIANRNENK